MKKLNYILIASITLFIGSTTILYAQKNKKGIHPAIFPDELVEMCIKISNIKSGVILDCFCGSGTTIRVGEKYNLSGIGIDTDELYINHCITTIGINSTAVNQFYQNNNQNNIFRKLFEVYM